jgi:cytochrome c peroxidase
MVVLAGAFSSVLCLCPSVGQETYKWVIPLGLVKPRVPEDNPVTPEKVALGRDLYNDKRLSADGTVSCATCHDPKKAFTDGLPIAKGIRGLLGTRNSPTVLNSVYFEKLFWDGRVDSLEEQAKQPFINPVEAGLPSLDHAVEIVRKDPSYRERFKRVFGVEPQQITIDHIVKAIATFERTLISGDSPFDRWRFGGDESAVSELVKEGFEVFKGKGRCQSCHTTSETFALFTDNKFHNIGVGFKKIAPRVKQIVRAYRKAKREGRSVDELVLTNKEISELGRFAVTLKLRDLGAFKTPTVRNVALTAPYMHDGSVATLEEVVELYDRGGEKNPFLDGGIRPLNLTKREKKALVEFMKSLTSHDLLKRP